MSCWGAVAAFLALPWIERNQNLAPRLLLFVPCLLMALAGICFLVLAGWTDSHALGHGTATPIENRDTFMDAIAGISPGLWGRFLILLWIFGAAALLAGTASAFFAWRGRFFAALMILAGSAVVPICLAAEGFTIMSPYFSLADNARAINRQIDNQPDALVACEARPNTASSLLYYLHARVHWVNAPFDNQYAQQVLGLGRDYYWDETEMRRRWDSPAPVYFIIEESRLPFWQTQLLAGFHILNRSGTRLVLSNR